ncbi:hypothetical protein Emtol_1749 [Emticicia oligotrophica DSM 17448]|jgi:membrane protease YdiL (CAAX protease family)|uniref:Major facilitator superfamily (MFS) profile domain-containing protein n=1 Tax=Emticicia oligotrophica (strain DSM 17448 / CIP 109782 / MTCC 6937 / GPTSA100-15) TaxID=929562 RepID=A0ABM5N0B1_EMTOG|nr:hypothetical protein [Emticicia oligotrophica]AFK02891.1 hypothetical protein Emtol_1749 [Emticicia oligotrophica DSM 17448]
MKLASIIVNIIAIIGFIPSVYMALFSPMLFDSGATTRTWILFSLVVSIPVSILITQIISWILFFKGNYTWALGMGLTPLIFLILLAIMFMISESLT